MMRPCHTRLFPGELLIIKHGMGDSKMLVIADSKVWDKGIDGKIFRENDRIRLQQV